MKPTHEKINKILASIRGRMLAAETVTVRAEAGSVKRENYDSGYIEHEPNGGLTYTIDINGGANKSRRED